MENRPNFSLKVGEKEVYERLFTGRERFELTRRKNGPVDKCEDVEHSCDVGVVVSAGLLQVLKRLFAEWHGDFVASLRGVLNDL